MDCCVQSWDYWSTLILDSSKKSGNSVSLTIPEFLSYRSQANCAARFLHPSQSSKQFYLRNNARFISKIQSRLELSSEALSHSPASVTVRTPPIGSGVLILVNYARRMELISSKHSTSLSLSTSADFHRSASPLTSLLIEQTNIARRWSISINVFTCE